jgi:hypothetical protein
LSSGEHLTQVYTGFALLARKGMVRLRVRPAAVFESGILGVSRLAVTVGDGLKLVYDTFDGANLDEAMLLGCDHYFKRSYDPTKHPTHSQGRKIHPLGFNCSVYTAGDFAWRRCLWSWFSDKSPWWRSSLLLVARNSSLLSRLLLKSNGRHSCALQRLEAEPACSKEPAVLFFSRLWDPEGQRTTERKAERERLNKMRADCIRGLRREFGRRFVGGLEGTDYARKHFSDCVIDRNLTRKTAYLGTVRDADICISTLGLLQSNPWKLAEYVAMSRAIVSERLAYAVPGDFTAGQNYLEFTTPDQCVAQAAKLACDPQKRYEMMLRNYAYYHAFLRPDMLIWNTLQFAQSAGLSRKLAPDPIDGSYAVNAASL